jgi:hypothetical protein
MYGRYSEDLGQYAKLQAKRIRALKRNEELLLENKTGFNKYTRSNWQKACISKLLESLPTTRIWLHFLIQLNPYASKEYFITFWKHTFGRIGEDWLFLALLGT